jgi:hypothetical protein
MYRYELHRRWDNRDRVVFVGLNPSTADDSVNDATTRRCISIAKDLGFGSMTLINLFAVRSTDPKALRSFADPIGIGNDVILKKHARDSSIKIAMWGNYGTYLHRDRYAKSLFPELHCFRITKENQPSHVLYLPKEIELRKFI